MDFGTADVNREHVYRRHAAPIHCTRCGQVFETETALTNHSRSTVVCEIRSFEAPEGFNKEQEKKLRSRKREGNPTEEDLWRKMYRILFPLDDNTSIPSPCKSIICSKHPECSNWNPDLGSQYLLLKGF